MMKLFMKVLRRFHPVMMKSHGNVLAERADALKKAMDDLLAAEPMPARGSAGKIFLEASIFMIDAIKQYNAIGDDQAGVINAMKAARKFCKAQELLFGLRYDLREIDCFFRERPSESAQQEDDDRHYSARNKRDRIICLGAGSDPYARKKASFFMPEMADRIHYRPLVIALHGGFGHGRDFIWSWIREARTMGFFLLAPTSKNMTWSIMTPDDELSYIIELLEKISSDHPVDRRRVLLTGFSDGATFALSCAMKQETPFSAFSAVSGVLPPGNIARAAGRRIFLAHGAYDWVFPVMRAQAGLEALTAAGAEVRLDIINDLAHAYPIEKNKAILEWFDPGVSLANGSTS